MNILFLTMNPFTVVDMHNIYSDLMLEFIRHGHRPYIVTPREKKLGEKTELVEYEDYGILKVQVGNTFGVGLIEKGVSLVMLSGQYYRAVKKYLGKMEFGLMLYSTPPITLAGPVKKLKKLFGCPTYLMLKDIFPQNAVDLGMFSRKNPIYAYFTAKERMLYQQSDRIGCMSQANVEFLKKNHLQIPTEKIQICPNGILPSPVTSREAEKQALREKYAIPPEATVYLFGGNLGKPQAIDHLVECLKQNQNRNDRYFIICGSGSEFCLLERFFAEHRPVNMQLISFLPKAEYDVLVRGCDVGLLFLDKRFTIPNYPSRILTYMEYGIPVIACTDRNTDVGTDAYENGYGLWCESTDPAEFTACVEKMNHADQVAMGAAARTYLEQNFTAAHCYQIMMENK
ncbi:MAG: glycosyltransferase family 4 protein [Oscillospiraceae bacterium]|nr:glycosyltransferase family 4 protein [Oscillospiraceae bacterium]